MVTNYIVWITSKAYDQVARRYVGITIVIRSPTCSRWQERPWRICSQVQRIELWVVRQWHVGYGRCLIGRVIDSWDLVILLQTYYIQLRFSQRL